MKNIKKILNLYFNPFNFIERLKNLEEEIEDVSTTLLSKVKENKEIEYQVDLLLEQLDILYKILDKYEDILKNKNENLG
jgi:hypothetical protein